jgi:predicted membrane protein
VFLVVFGLGWFLIVLLTAVFTNQTQWWALIPGGIIGFVGLAILFGGVFMKTLTAVSFLWPVVLIIVGVYVLWKARQPTEKTLEE